MKCTDGIPFEMFDFNMSKTLCGNVHDDQKKFLLKREDEIRAAIVKRYSDPNVGAEAFYSVLEKVILGYPCNKYNCYDFDRRFVVRLNSLPLTLFCARNSISFCSLSVMLLTESSWTCFFVF